MFKKLKLKNFKKFLSILVVFCAICVNFALIFSPPSFAYSDAKRIEFQTNWNGAKIYYDNLPLEARQTLELILAGGPFRHRRDGVVFHNREGILPHNPRGFYREYTVPTPGIDSRGARRIIVGGKNLIFYYTGDHYRSFYQIIR